MTRHDSFRWLSFVGGMIAFCGCGEWPPIVNTQADIHRLPETTVSVRARGLRDEYIPALGRLKRLNYLDFAGGMAVEDAPITDVGLQHLSKLSLSELDTLELGYCKHITDAGLAHVGQIKTVTTLQLSACPKITDAGLPELLKMERLTYLDLRGCQKITDAGLLELAAKSNLTYLDLGGCRSVTAQGIAKLQTTLPGLKISKDDLQWNKYFRQYE